MPENIESLPPGFPSFVLDPGFGQWWKVHSKPYGPWFFVSDDPQRHLIGRFDFPAPNGTLYVGDCLGGVTPESVREENVTAAESQRAYNDRRLSAMPLDALYGKRIADFTSGAVRYFGAPVDVAALTRAEARPWARAAHRRGFDGILYQLREDPKRRLGLAVFGEAGAADPPPNQPYPQELPSACGRRSSRCWTVSTAATRYPDDRSGARTGGAAPASAVAWGTPGTSVSLNRYASRAAAAGATGGTTDVTATSPLRS